MKKIIYSLVLTLVVAVVAHSQTKGITYQAVIYDPLYQQQTLPGVDNGLIPYANKDICIKFEITDSSSNRVYIETQKITTDAFGIVNTIIGKGTRIGGSVASFELINWNKQANGLVVSIDTSNSCNNYVQVSDQPFTATPFSLGSDAINPDNYALTSNLSTNVTTDATSDIKYPSVKAIKGYVDTALGTVANINSPALTGVPTAPTAPAGTSNTQLATTEFVTNGLLFKEDAANKSTDGTLISNSDVLYPSVKAVKTYIDNRPFTMVGTSLNSISSPSGTSLGQLIYNTNPLSGVPVGPTYWDGTSWQPIAGTYSVVGNEVVGATTNGGLIRTGSGTTTDPFKLKIIDGTSANQTIVWNGSAWVAGNTGLVATPLTSASNPVGVSVGQMVYNTNATINIPVGPVYWDGTSWISITNNSSTGAGAPTATTPANAVAGDVYVNSTNGDIYTYNGTAWENQSGVSADANNVLVNGTDGLAYLSQAAIKGASGVSSGVGVPTATSPANAEAGDIYVNETTGDIYTYNGTTWTNATTTSTGVGAPTATTPANAVAGDIYVNETTGDIYTYNGTAWENQSGVSADANNVLVNGTDGLAYLSQAAIAANETVTTLVDNADGTYTYTSENGTITNFTATPEPWKNAATATVATDNTQNIFQMGNVGLGLNNPTSQLHTAGPIATPISTSVADVTLDNTHSVVRIDATTGDKTITLPAAASAVGRMYTVVKTDGTSNKLIFSSTIKGSDFTFTQLNVPGSYLLQSDGTDWVLVK